MGSQKIHSIIAKGDQGTLVDIECHLSNNLPTIIIVGFANKAVDEARERIRGAFASSRIMLPRKRITVNLAPADIPKADSSFDLAIAVSILAAGGEVTQTLPAQAIFIGELGLDGATRAVRGIIGKILIGRALGITIFYIPRDNIPQAALVPGVTLVPIGHLSELYGHLALGLPINHLKTGQGRYLGSQTSAETPSLLSEIIDQAAAKRALEIAAAGGHNILLSGPPGTGKSMLGRALASLLPPLSREEALEVTHLHSLANVNYESIITERPFRAPHHSASHVAIVGGGSRLRPGEISLAHRGVLFLDELPEFSRETIEALRQPLEDRVISLARAQETAEYPANFIFVATANLCPCGYVGQPRCTCRPYEITRYQLKLSGPILDRIDLSVHVGLAKHDRLLNRPAGADTDEVVRKRIRQARAHQLQRFGAGDQLNAAMSGVAIRQHALLLPEARALLDHAAQAKELSARAYYRTIKVARTIADLENMTHIAQPHIAEALSFHYKPPNKDINEEPS